jgi:predicted transcriptional regulator
VIPTLIAPALMTTHSGGKRVNWDMSPLTQDEVAQKLKTKKSAISRIENHAVDLRLSTIRRYTEAVGVNLQIRIVSSQKGNRKAKRG